MKTAFVTGGSSGIGRCTAAELAKAGYRVYEISRRNLPQGGITHITADVTKEETLKQAVEQILAEAGSLDLLVNCAGFGISGAAEFTQEAAAQKQMDVNFMGTVRACKAVLTHMRERRSGRIVNISSVAAPVAIPFQAFYSASKAAINSYTCALANEVRPYGIQVTAVQPGDIRTGFTRFREKETEGDAEYGGRISRSVSVMERDEENGMTPEAAARYIVKICKKRRVKPLYTIGFSYQLICVAVKLLPCRLIHWIVGKIYAK